MMDEDVSQVVRQSESDEMRMMYCERLPRAASDCMVSGSFRAREHMHRTSCTFESLRNSRGTEPEFC